jgi:ABC-type nitrate/sulfonate/bicarbonate transport system ATPase subunit
LAENILEIKNLSKAYHAESGSKQIVLENLDLLLKSDTENGSFNSILAPLGSGKTTLLKIIAGLENFEGEVNFNGIRISRPTGDIIFIPEKPSSLPWLNVKENIELPSKLFRRQENLKTFQTNELIELVGLGGYEDYFTSLLVSGFRQRIAIARALSFNPKIILLDDVLKNLDGETRTEFIDLLKFLTVETKTPFLLATTNISDAVLMSQKVFLMRKNPGKIVKELDIQKEGISENSEIITKLKNEIEHIFQTQGMLNSVLISV